MPLLPWVLLLGLLAAGCGAPTQRAVGDFDPQAIDSLFAMWDRDDTPGCALAVVRDGRIVHARGYGMADLERNVAITPETVFRIGSTSKQVTAAVILLLAQDGVLSLDDDLRRWVPEIPDYGATITLRHLLHHTSGLRDYLELMALAGREDGYGDQELLAMLARQQATDFPPGSAFGYSNSGYYLLSVVCARATGMSLRACAEERIFAPLGMTRTHFHDDHRELVPGRALGYDRDADGPWYLSMTTLEMCGDGGVFTTVEDFARWDENFYSGAVGGPRFLEAMLTPGEVDPGPDERYAAGLAITERRGLPMVLHSGAFVGFRAEMVRFPEQHLSILCFANAAEFDPTARCLEVADLLLAEVYPEPVAAASPAAAPRRKPTGAAAPTAAPRPSEDLVGLFHSAELGVDYQIALRNGDLELSFGDARLPLSAAGVDEYRSPAGLTVRFLRDIEGRTDGFVLDAWRAHGIRFERR